MMTSGPVTFFLLYDHRGQAMGNWRKDIGRLKDPEPTTIRAFLVKDLYNNLVHGSDSKAAVHNEIAFLARELHDIACTDAT